MNAEGRRSKGDRDYHRDNFSARQADMLIQWLVKPNLGLDWLQSATTGRVRQSYHTNLDSIWKEAYLV